MRDDIDQELLRVLLFDRDFPPLLGVLGRLDGRGFSLLEQIEDGLFGFRFGRHIDQRRDPARRERAVGMVRLHLTEDDVARLPPKLNRERFEPFERTSGDGEQHV